MFLSLKDKYLNVSSNISGDVFFLLGEAREKSLLNNIEGINCYFISGFGTLSSYCVNTVSYPSKTSSITD